MFVDTHCHLTKRLCPDVKRTIVSAEENGVTRLIGIGTNLEDSQETVTLAQQYPNVYAAVGIHPEETCSDWVAFEKLINQPKVVAVGECGLDNKVGRPEQWEIFFKQIVLAKKHHQPLIIHSRNAAEETLSMLNEHSKIRGVFHFYSFGKSKIKKIVDMGFYFGIDGNLTYDRGFQEVVKEIPLERLVLETDSPFLAPHPLRGSINEPKNVTIIARCLADIKNTSLDEVERITTLNAQKLFGIN